MKYLLWRSALLLLCVGTVYGQAKIGYVDSQSIMQKLPEGQDAQKQLDALVAQWQGEITKMQNDWQQKYGEYDKKKLIMSDQTRAEAERELVTLEKKVTDYRNQKFGPNGEMFTKQNELLKPVQDRVFKAIQDVAVEENYDYVLDKSGQILLLYANDKYDLTPQVLLKLQVPTK
ncbi:MAG: OmpH family outer membrane protein [Bacteroidota bacterium]